MDKKEIKDYLKRVDELGAKLSGEDKETYTWLIYGYNQCVKLLNETEQQCKKQKEVINKAIEYIEENMYSYYDNNGEKCIEETVFERSANPKELLNILQDKEVSE